ncbi:MAG: hypothetical protein WC356_05645 [Candidatus Micrarchaeia archaeon]|jgi:hypothetical protein
MEGFDHYITRADEVFKDVNSGKLTVPQAEEKLQRILKTTETRIGSDVRELAPNDTTNKGAVLDSSLFAISVVTFGPPFVALGIAFAPISASIGGIVIVGSTLVGTIIPYYTALDFPPDRPWRTVSEEGKKALYNKTMQALGNLEVDKTETLKSIPKKK